MAFQFRRFLALNAAISTINRKPIRLLSAANYGGGAEEFDGGKTAYEVLEVSETSSFSDIKASFRRLAKETHPDVISADAADSQRFVQILAAYEILSDSKKRDVYDNCLFSQRTIVHNKGTGFGSGANPYRSSVVVGKQSNVVEWLRWYRLTVEDIIAERRIGTRSGYFGALESELYSAIRTAYYGPLIDSMDLLPECFEVEERSINETLEVLHLVSGRELFGMVIIVDRVPELLHKHHQKLNSFDSMASEVHEHTSSPAAGTNSPDIENAFVRDKRTQCDFDSVSDAYKDLELHIYGRLVATATRQPKCECLSNLTSDSEDHIHIFLTMDETQDNNSTCPSRSKMLLGTITGLGTSAEEDSCSVFDRSGIKTHVIMKHRTLMVRHMHWFQVHDESSPCECRCSRARLLPSKYWLFEPRCDLHDVGGWYVETFGRDKKGKTIASARQWDGEYTHNEKRLHPAIYLLALAYRTLDLEHAKRRKWSVMDLVEPRYYSIVDWCKKHFRFI